MKPIQRTLKDGHLKPLSKLVEALGLATFFTGNFTLEGADPILRSPHHLGEAVSFALALDAIAAAAIWEFRTGAKNDLSLSIYDAIHYLHPPHFVWQSAHKIHLGAETVPTNGLYHCKDGRIVMIESGPPYKKLENGYLNFFNCGNNPQAIAQAIAKWDSTELENRLSELGLPCCIAYSKEEWLQHPQGRILKNTPVIEIEKISDGKPYAFSEAPCSPLSGIRVLDHTHVLAGPRSARTLAEFGAEVLHISSPYHRDTLAQNLAVNHGKRSAYLELTQEKDMLRMRQLIEQADVFVDSYRPSVAEKFGLMPSQLEKLSKKGIICLSINCYGHDGPWKSRPGFDQNGQVATGFSMAEGGKEKPKFSPVFYLNDLITAYFAAAGMMGALLLRATQGGSYHVKVSLARSAMWVQDLGHFDPTSFNVAPTEDNYPVNLITEETLYGKLTHLAPAVKFSNMPPVKLLSVAPFGAHEAKWLTEGPYSIV